MTDPLPKNILFITALILIEENRSSPTVNRQLKIIEHLSRTNNLKILSLNLEPRIFQGTNFFAKIFEKVAMKIINMIGDSYFVLINKYRKAIIAELKTNKYDTVITTIYPPSFVSLIRWIKKYAKSAKIILDMSDPVTAGVFFNDYAYPKRKLFSSFETKYLKQINVLVVLNKEIKEYYEAKFPGLKVIVVEVGLDEHTICNSFSRTKININGNINLLYAGIFYEKLREPFNLYSAILSGPANVKLFIYGSCSRHYQPPKSEKLIYGGLISKDEMKEKYGIADIIVFIDNFYGVQVPAKTFEVFATQKPILFIYENGKSPSLNYAKEHDGIFYAKNTVDSIKSTLLSLTKNTKYIYPRDLTKYYWANILKEFDNII